MVDAARQKEIESQIGKLAVELARAKEPVVREALEAKIASLTAELPAPVEPEPEPGPARDLTPDERRKFDLEIQRARLMVGRGERDPAEAGVKSLAAEYGEQPEILELRGDLAMGRKRVADARAFYDLARKLRPKDAALERKYADAVFGATGIGSLEDQLRASESSTPLLDVDASARGGIATALSLFVPGLGQWVLGRQIKGIVFFSIWGVATLYVLAHGKMIPGLFRTIGFGHGGEDPSGLFVLALLVAAGAAFGAVIDCAAMAKRAPKITTERPKPPVDLPFE